MGVLSKKKMMEEMVKCTKSPHYFLLNYGYVRHPGGGHIRFKLFEYQKDSITNFRNNRFNISLKSRQTGLSTITAGYIAWLMIFFKAKEIVVVSNKQKNAQGFIRKVKLIIKKCPNWMVPKITSDNKGSIELANGSMVTAEATTSDAAKSESLSLLVIDEAAAIDTKKVDDLWGSAYPTLSLGGAAIVISTPKGVGNWYHKQWLRSRSGESDFISQTIHWTEHPTYSLNAIWTCSKCGHKQNYGNIKEKIPCENCYENTLVPTSPWYEDQCRQLGDPRLIAQELDMDFLGSGDQVIREEYIKKAERKTSTPIRIAGFDNNLYIWKEPKEGRNYLISADVARGDGTDYSACHVIDLENREQAAEYMGKMPPDMYAKFLYELGMEYNEALVAIEANSIGYATCLKIVDMKYPNIFYSAKGQANARDKRKLERAYKNKEAMIPGFQTTTATRPLLMTQLEEEVRNGTFKINSIRLISELRTLIWNNGKAEAMHGYHDDLSMSAAIGLLIISTTLNDMISSRDSIIASLRAIRGESENANDSIPILNKAFSRERRTNNPWVMTTRQGTEEDLSWLIGRGKK